MHRVQQSSEPCNPLPLPYADLWTGLNCPKCNSLMAYFLHTNTCPKCGTSKAIIIKEMLPITESMRKPTQTYQMTETVCITCGEFFEKRKGSTRIYCTTCDKKRRDEIYKKKGLGYCKAHKDYTCYICNKPIYSREIHYFDVKSHLANRKRWHENCNQEHLDRIRDIEENKKAFSNRVKGISDAFL